MKKIFLVLMAVMCMLTFTAFGCGDEPANNGGDNSGNGGGTTATLTVNMNATTGVSKTDVGVILYATASDASATCDFTFENGSKTTAGASIGVIDGKQYMRASAAGSYTVKVVATKGDLTATATKTIVVDGDTAFSYI